MLEVRTFRGVLRHGAATWTVDENGARVFRWKEQEQGEK